MKKLLHLLIKPFIKKKRVLPLGEFIIDKEMILFKYEHQAYYCNNIFVYDFLKAHVAKKQLDVMVLNPSDKIYIINYCAYTPAAEVLDKHGNRGYILNFQLKK